MKNIFKIIACGFIVTSLVVFGFGQRGSFGGGSRSFGGGSSFSSSRTSSSSSSSSSFGRSGGFGSSNSTRSSNVRSYSSPSYSRQSFNSSVRSSSVRVNVRSNYRIGYRPSLSVHYYGHPYFYNGLNVYWYGDGYYSTYPGGPLLLGNPGMPGYSAAYGYDPYYNAPVATPGYFLWSILGGLILLIVLGIIIKSMLDN